MWLRCPEQWRFRYVEKKVIPPGAALVVGSATHVPAGEYHQRGIRLGNEWSVDAGRDQMTSEEAEDLARDAFEILSAGRDPGGKYPDGAPVDWSRESVTAGQACDRAIVMSRKYVADVAPGCGRPLQSEDELSPVKGREFNLVCKPDLVAEEMGTGRIVLHDLKTSGKAPNGIKCGTIAVDDDARRQLVLYRFALRLVANITLDAAGIDFVWDNKSGAHSVHAPVEMVDGDEEEVIEQLRSMDSAVRAGTFIKNTSHNMCGPRWCGFFSLCRPHRVSVQVSATAEEV
jgi:hypothetical protein